MTIQELSKYHDIVEEIIQLKNSIEELSTTIIGSSKVTGMPMTSTGGNNSPTERIGIKLALLKEKLEKKKEDLIDEAHKIEDFLETIDDSEIRIIIRKRFLEGKTWDVISREINTDRSTPYYKVQKYLKGREQNEEEKNTCRKL